MKNLDVCLFVFLTISLQTCLAVTGIPFPPTMMKQPSHEQLFQVSQSQDEHEKPFALDCEANGNPEPTYRWKKNGDDFDFESAEGRITKQAQKGTLYINHPQDSDEAVYQCLAENIHGISLSNTVSLRKSELNSVPGEEPKEVFVKEGEPLSLKCIPPSGYPKPTIFWNIQSHTGALHSINSSRMTVDPNGDLHFTNVTVADTLNDAQYVCNATSVFRNEYKLGNKILLRVEAAGTDPSLNKYPPTEQFTSPPNIVALRGQKLELSCMYGGTPVPSIVWSKKGGNLLSGPVTYTNYGKTLKIRRVDFKDEGTYECTAINGVGTPTSHSMIVTVKAAPYWVNAPNNTNRAEGEGVSFECVAGGVPIPEVKWYMNGVPLEDVKPNPRRKLDKSENILVISGLEKSDTAVFQCNASNIYGYVFRDFYLNIIAVPPNIRKKPEPVTSTIASSLVTLKCHVFGVPIPKIKWLKESQEVTGDRFQVLDSGDLEINNVNSEDEGEYTCYAANKFGNMSASGRLEVKNTPNPPRILDLQCDGLTAMFMWEPTGDRRSPIQTYTIQYNTSFTPNSWEDAVGNIPAPNTNFKVSLTPWANYTFRVIAHNKIGPSEPSDHSEVCETPEDVPFKNPDNVVGKGTEKDNLVISWTAMPMIEQNAPGFFYKIFWKREDIPQAWQVFENQKWRKNSYIIPNQPTFKPYRIKVEAHNSLGRAHTAATEIIGYSGEDVPLEEPKNFKLLYIKDSRSAMFSWDPVPPDSVRGHFRGYKIQTWTRDEGEEHLREQIVKANVTQSLVTIFKPFSHNLVRVFVFSDTYNGPSSHVLEFFPPEDTPGPVAFFDAIPLGSSALYLIWKCPTEPNGLLTGYNIYYREVIGTELGAQRERTPPITDPIETRAKLVGLKPKTKYRIDIYATTSKGQGQKTYIEVQTNDQTERQPDEPYFVWSHLAEVDGKASVRVTWVPAVEGYPGSHFFVQYRKKGESRWESSQLEEDQDSILVEGLELGSVYEVKVVAVDGPFQTSSKVAEFYAGKMDAVQAPEPEQTFETPAWFVGMMFAIGVLLLLVMIIFAVKRHRLSNILFRISGGSTNIQDL